MRSVRVLIIMAVALALAACGSDKKSDDVNTPVPGIKASGGTSTSGSGGNGGYVYLESYGGAVKVLKSGTVGAVVTVPTYTPDFGTDPTAHAVVSAGTSTTVLLDNDDFSGRLAW